MGSGDWFKTIISRKKRKDSKSKRTKDIHGSEIADQSTSKTDSEKDEADRANGAASEENRAVGVIGEDAAAVRIQTAFRAFIARKCLRKKKGIVRLQKLTQAEVFNKQSMSTLTHLHSWSRIQSQIIERRHHMEIEGRLKQKKLENQQKLEAKLHDLEVEWCDGSDTMDEILARIHQREEAAVKRERALAYAFTHQWKANPNQNQNQGVNASELGKANWGWSWQDRWIAARPWESRVESQSTSPKKVQCKLTSKSLPMKPNLPNGKGPAKARRLSFLGPTAEDQSPRVRAPIAPKEVTVS